MPNFLNTVLQTAKAQLAALVTTVKAIVHQRSRTGPDRR